MYCESDFFNLEMVEMTVRFNMIKRNCEFLGKLFGTHIHVTFLIKVLKIVSFSLEYLEYLEYLEALNINNDISHDNNDSIFFLGILLGTSPPPPPRTSPPL